MFHVGQKVVFVGWRTPWYLRPFVTYKYNAPLDVNRIYTVSAVYDFGWGRKALDLIEAPHPYPSDAHPGWISFAFRPAVERKTDISVFEKLLTPAHKKEPSNG